MKLSLLLASACALVGCGGIMINGHPMDQRGHDDVAAAVAHKDWATLDAMCADDSSHTERAARTEACEAARSHDVALVVAAPCEQKQSALDQQAAKHGTVGGTAEVAQSFFACKQGDRFVADHGGWVSAAADFEDWEDAGMPITETALRILASPSVSGLDPDRIAGLVEYVVKKRAFGSCEPLVASFRKAPMPALREAGPYFVAAKCAGAVPLFEAMLTENDPALRKGACFSLGEIGGASSLPKLSVLAQTDAAFEIVDLNKVYYVRDACRAAAGKVVLRHAGTGGRVSAR